MKTFLSPYISSLRNKLLLSVITVGNSNNYVWHHVLWIFTSVCLNRGWCCQSCDLRCWRDLGVESRSSTTGRSSRNGWLWNVKFDNTNWIEGSFIARNLPFYQLDVLEEVVKAVRGRCDVYMDGGVRRGTDVLKALALGAKAVFIGRPVLWGLSCQVNVLFGKVHLFKNKQHCI